MKEVIRFAKGITVQELVIEAFLIYVFVDSIVGFFTG